jgi:hypothetical protein
MLRRSIVALLLLSFLLVIKPTLQMCILFKSDKQFVNTLLDNITHISDRAQVEISERVKQVLRELHQQHQNPAEH